jgi:hypothetical protein
VGCSGTGPDRLDNKYVVTDAAPGLRPHAAHYAEDNHRYVACVSVCFAADHTFLSAEEPSQACSRSVPRTGVHCDAAFAERMPAALCEVFFHPSTTSKQIQAICGPNTGRDCFEQRERNANAPSPAAAKLKAAAPEAPLIIGR